MGVRCGFFCALALSTQFIGVDGQLAAQSQQLPTFRAGVNVMRVGVSVVDKNGVPIRGLTVADFTVFEDGKPRPIVGFEAVDLPPAAADPEAPAWIRNTPRDVVTNSVDADRLFLIVMDDLTMPIHPGIIESAKQIARMVVAQLGEHDRAAVVFARHSSKAQPFTSDHAALLAAIDTMSFGLVDWSDIQASDIQYIRNSVNTLHTAVDVMSGAPQLRKSIVFISTGVATVGLPTPNSMHSWEQERQLRSDLRDDLRRLYEIAKRGHVRLYPIDPGGALGFETYLHRNARTTTDFGSAGIAADAAVRSLNLLADETGGRATVGNTKPETGIARMFEDSRTYYIIGFERASDRPGDHRLKIRTSLKGAEVQTPQFYEIAAPKTANPKRPVTPIDDAIRSVLPQNELPMRVATTVLPSDDDKPGTVAVAVGINQPAENVMAPERITAQVNVYQIDGTFVTSRKLDAQATLTPDHAGRAEYELLTRFSLPPGRYQLRVAAENARLNVRGSVFADVDVPNFSREVVTLSPLVLSMSPGPQAAPQDAFAADLPTVPTSHRAFIGSDVVSILARTHQGGNTPLVAVALDATIVDARGATVFTQSDRKTPSAGVTRSVDWVFEVPIAKLTTGDFLLTVTAHVGPQTSMRTLRFSRR